MLRSPSAVSLIAVGTALLAGPAGEAVPRALAASRTCRIPQLTGVTVENARVLAARAGCQLRLRGAAPGRPDVQTIERQSPRRGRRAVSVTVWVNPFCFRGGDYAPQLKEPAVTRGPTELVTGFYLVGGVPAPARRFSSPDCRLPEPPPGAGTVEVSDAAGTVLARQTSTRGRFIRIPLPPGSYTIRGTFLDATENGVNPTETQSIVIPAGHTVRQDFFLSIK